MTGGHHLVFVGSPNTTRLAHSWDDQVVSFPLETRQWNILHGISCVKHFQLQTSMYSWFFPCFPSCSYDFSTCSHDFHIFWKPNVTRAQLGQAPRQVVVAARSPWVPSAIPTCVVGPASMSARIGPAAPREATWRWYAISVINASLGSIPGNIQGDFTKKL